MDMDKYIEKARYYEELSRQYRELEDFEEALEFTTGTTLASAIAYSYDKNTELKISTHISHTVEYSINLIKDLGMGEVNEAVRQLLVDEVKKRMIEIERELEAVFGKEE